MVAHTGDLVEAGLFGHAQQDGLERGGSFHEAGHSRVGRLVPGREELAPGQRCGRDALRRRLALVVPSTASPPGGLSA